MAKFTFDSLAKFRTCPSCGAEIDDLIIGGVGDWRNKIICVRCFKVQKGIPFDEIIVPLAACKHDLSEQSIRNADSISQDEYENIILNGSIRKDLPAVPEKARWLSRRLLESSP